MNKIHALLKEKEAIMSGHFVLTSGLHSNMYIEKFRVLEDPSSLDIICKEMASKFNNIDIVISAAIGGILISSGVAKELGTKGIFAERVNGELVFKRGFKIPEKSNVLIVDISLFKLLELVCKPSPVHLQRGWMIICLRLMLPVS